MKPEVPQAEVCTWPQCLRENHRACCERGMASQLEDQVRKMVQLRIMQATRRARGDLWSARAGLHVLSAEQAYKFGATMRELDGLLTLLGGTP